ncbi:cytochrome c oxidase assembly protein [Pseudofulvimonas gallinarii]|uniref:Cytochrome c oxidase assembly protein CtaG n=1 Tax=Pseudofulvimonas gallinarii TaxID=634155 RepID=A0A4R3L2U0_9GAMM|nr:cytochrome c oxidase assembly protein [Pseudofulvimonas gallinarii]TCS93789.1 cytochrome c oxidase assembly protein subunit 11 [Pseudofulvimonas gallinarii]
MSTPQSSNSGHENRRLLGKVALVTAGAFAFCFTLVPLYRIACEQVFGIRMNDNGAVGVEGIGALEVDLSRTVKVQFDASIHNEREWRFVPDQVEMDVHPGQVLEAWYTATNLTGDTLVAQAVPDVAPKRGLPYFNKTECFCFTEQLFEPGEIRRMPVRFFISPDLPDEVRTLTLSYAFYNNEHATRREQARMADATGSIDATRG